MEKSRRIINADSIVGIITLLIAAAFISMSRDFPGASSDGVPGAGYFPTFISIFVIIFSVLLIGQGFIKQQKYFQKESEKKKSIMQMLEVYGALIVFFILWNLVPFIIAAIVFEVLLCIILKCSWKFTAIFSIAVVLLMYLIFTVAFKVSLNI